MALSLKMNLDKKSLIQIVVLVVLIAVGAGAYFMQQGGGGLDFITGFFESKPATTRAPAVKTQAPAADKKSGTAPAADVKAKADVPAIPATPAKGQIHGKPFVVESSSIENGGHHFTPFESEDFEIRMFPKVSIRAENPGWIGTVELNSSITAGPSMTSPAPSRVRS